MTIIQTQATIDRTWFTTCLKNKKLVAALKKIKLIICDIDGNWTDSRVYVSPQGEGGRLFSVQDGYVIKPLQTAGFIVALMSGKENSSTAQRAKTLKISDDLCMTGMDSKIEFVKKLQKKLGVSRDQTIMLGDDFMDANIKLNYLVSLYICPNNTPFYFQSIADVVIPRGGGDAAFRLFADLFLFVHGKHFAQDVIKQALT